MGFLDNKRILIVGVASNRSIAYGVARAMHREGAQLAFTYQGEKLHDRVTGFAAEFDSDIVLPLDVTSDEQIAEVFKVLGERWGGLDGIVKLNVYLTDLGNFATVNAIMQTYFAEPYPARAAVGVAALPLGAEVEMEAVLGL